MHGLVSSPATKHRATWAPGRATTRGEQCWRVKEEGSRGNPGSAGLCGFMQEEGWLCLRVCQALSRFLKMPYRPKEDQSSRTSQGVDSLF